MASPSDSATPWTDNDVREAMSVAVPGRALQLQTAFTAQTLYREGVQDAGIVAARLFAECWGFDPHLEVLADGTAVYDSGNSTADRLADAVLSDETIRQAVVEAALGSGTPAGRTRAFSGLYSDVAHVREYATSEAGPLSETVATELRQAGTVPSGARGLTGRTGPTPPNGPGATKSS